jgi:UPF0271 protein
MNFLDNMQKKIKFFIIDTSAILSGKPINIQEGKLVTTPKVSNEISAGGKDHRNFQFLLEKGLKIYSPLPVSINKIKKISETTGDKLRLSNTDIEILALAVEINKDKNKEAIILTDDYSIQNVAFTLKIKFQSFSQEKITKKFKWVCRCPGCGKIFRESIEICPICGKTTKSSFHSQENIEKK